MIFSLGVVVLLVDGTARAGEALPEIVSSAFFQTFDDSLSYTEFRELPGSEQLVLRKQARHWISRSREGVLASRGQSRDSRVVTSSQRQAALIDAYNAAATAVGYCPYMAEAWIQYAEVANYLGQYRTALACLVHAEKTIAYRSEEHTSELQSH